MSAVPPTSPPTKEPTRPGNVLRACGYILSGILLVCVWQSFQQLASLRGRSDEQERVTKMLQDQQDAWNAGDLERFLIPYHEDVIFYGGGTIEKGLPALTERYRKRYKSEGKEMGTLKFDDLELFTLEADAMFARGRWQVAKSKETTGGLFTLILRKSGGDWKIVHDHTSQQAP